MRQLFCSLLLPAGLLLSALGAKAAAPALDLGILYKNPWGPTNPQNRHSGFAPWTFDFWNPPTQSPAKPIAFIDRQRGAWGINVPADIEGQQGYDGVWASFTGDGQLDPGQTFTTVTLFTPPGAYSTTETPTEGFDLFALDPTVPSNYLSFGHQVLGIYLGPTKTGYSFTLAVHNALNDEQADKFITLPLKLTATANHFQYVTIIYTQLPQGNWSLKLASPGQSALVLTSSEYGPTWNTTTGLDAVRWFCSQGGTNPIGPLEWTEMSVSGRPATNPTPVPSATPKAP